MSCASCGEPLGCAVDCPNAPWNHDKSRTTRMAHLTRLVRWVRSLSVVRTPVGFTLSDLRWIRR